MPIQIVINENYVAKILIHPRQCKKMTFTKIEKENTEIFADFPHSFNECIKNGVFLSYFKKTDTTLIYNKGSEKTSKTTTDQSAFYQIF